MAAPYREGRARTSVAWDHFEIKDREKGIATCNICHDDFSYRSSVSNLMKHLRTRHGYSVIKCEDEDSEQIENEGNKSKAEPKIKTELWEYYDVKDEENKLATCKICLEQFSFATSMEILFGHLSKQHSIDFEKETEKSDDEIVAADDEDDFSLQSLSENKVRAKSSIAWEYFDIKDENKKVATCLTCGALISFKSSVSNLMKHARRKHGVDVEVQDEENILETLDVAEVADSKIFTESVQEVSRSHQRSIVWLYFKCIDTENKVSKCLLCHKMLSHSSTLTNLKKHLARKHPNVKIPAKEDGRKRILLSSGGELYEVETASKIEAEEDDDENIQNDTLEMDTVYLEDFESLQQEETPKKGPNKTRKRTYSSSSEDEVTFFNRYKRKQMDSFDHFGKYLASLLRNLPKESSSKLQVDFMRQIMEVDKERL